MAPLCSLFPITLLLHLITLAASAVSQNELNGPHYQTLRVGSLECLANSQEVVKIGTPLTLNTGAWNWRQQKLMRYSYEFFVNWLNRERGGVYIQGTWRPVCLILIEDDGSEEVARNATEHLVYDLGVNILLGPYGSDLAQVSADVVNESGAVAIMPAATALEVYEDRPQVFGILPAAERHIELAFELLAGKAKTVAYFSEDTIFTRHLTNPIKGLAKTHNMTFKGHFTTKQIPAQATVANASLQLSLLNPDFVIIAAYEDACSMFVLASSTIGFNPLAMLVPEFCIRLLFSLDQFRAQYILGWNPWTSSLTFKSDLVNITATEFSDMIADGYAPFGQDDAPEYASPYQAASAFSAFEALIVAIEAANSTEPADIAAELQVMEHNSIFGPIKFDHTGRNTGAGYIVQTQDKLGDPYVVARGDGKETQKSLIYPMPRWEDRSCTTISDNETFSLYGFSITKPANLTVAFSRENLVASLEWGASVVSEDWETIRARLMQSVFVTAYWYQEMLKAPLWFSDQLSEIFTDASFDREEMARKAAIGFFSTKPGSKVCGPCPPDEVGQINEEDENRYRFCEDCPAGKTLVNLENLRRICFSECDAGMAHDHVSFNANGTCQACPVGTYNSGSTCKDCESGRYNDQVGQTQCTDCGKGEFVSREGMTRCKNCSVGKYSMNSGSKDCMNCDTGMFSNEDGRSYCQLCPAGSVAETGGSSACEVCPAGKYSERDVKTCAECPAGKYQHLPNQASCNDLVMGATFEGTGLKKGVNQMEWWTRDQNGVLTWEYCLDVPQGCLTGERCAEGATGVQCSSCLPGYLSHRFPSMKACQKCPPNWWNLISGAITMLVVTLLSLMFAWLSVSSIKHPQDVHVVMLKMLVDHGILMASMGMIVQQVVYEQREDVGDFIAGWINFLSMTAQWLRFDQMIETGYWSITCLVSTVGSEGRDLTEVLSSRYHSEWFLDSNEKARNDLEAFHDSTAFKAVVFWIFWPVMSICAASALSWVVLMGYGCKRRGFYKKANKFYRQLVRKGVGYVKDKYSEAEMLTFMGEYDYKIAKLWWPFQYLSTAHSYSYRQKFRAFLKDTKPVILASVWWSYSWVAMGVLAPWRCRKYGNEEFARMINGSTIQCYQTGPLMSVAALGSVIWGFAFPFFLARSLYRRSGITLSNDYLKENSLYIMGYTSSCLWWEGVIFFKKYIVILLAHLDFKPSYKISSQIFIAIIYGGLCTSMKPYDFRCNNILMKADSFFLAVWVLSATMVQFAYFSRTKWGWVLTGSVTMVTNWILCGFVAWILWRHTLFAFARDHLRKKYVKTWKKHKSGWCIKRLIKAFERYQETSPYIFFDPLLGWVTVCGDRGDLAIPPFKLTFRQGHMEKGRPALSQVRPVPIPSKDVKVSPGSHEQRAWLQRAIAETIGLVGIGVHQSATFSTSILEFVIRAGFLLSYRYSAKNPMKRSAIEGGNAEDTFQFVELCMEDTPERAQISSNYRKDGAENLATMISGRHLERRGTQRGDDQSEGSSPTSSSPRREISTRSTPSMGGEKSMRGTSTHMSMSFSKSDFNQIGTIDTRLELLEDNIRTLSEISKSELEERRREADEENRFYLKRLRERAQSVLQTSVESPADQVFIRSVTKGIRSLSVSGFGSESDHEITKFEDPFDNVLPGRQKQLLEWANLLFEPQLFKTGVPRDIFHVGLVALQSMPRAEVQFLMDAFEEQWVKHMKVRMDIFQRYSGNTVDAGVQVESVDEGAQGQLYDQALRGKAADVEEKKHAEDAEKGQVAAALQWARFAMLQGNAFHIFKPSHMCQTLKGGIERRSKKKDEQKKIEVEKQREVLQKQVQHRMDKEKEVVEMRSQVVETLEALRSRHEPKDSRQSSSRSAQPDSGHDEKMLELRAAYAAANGLGLQIKSPSMSTQV